MNNRDCVLHRLNEWLPCWVSDWMNNWSRALSALPEKTNRSKSYHTQEALKRYIEQKESREYEKQETLARWERYQKTGDVVSNDSMMDWLDSWGSHQEKPCPVK